MWSTSFDLMPSTEERFFVMKIVFEKTRGFFKRVDMPKKTHENLIGNLTLTNFQVIIKWSPLSVLQAEIEIKGRINTIQTIELLKFRYI